MRTEDVVALLRYVYGYTAESEKGLEDMRTMMTQWLQDEGFDGRRGLQESFGRG